MVMLTYTWHAHSVSAHGKKYVALKNIVLFFHLTVRQASCLQKEYMNVSLMSTYENVKRVVLNRSEISYICGKSNIMALCLLHWVHILHNICHLFSCTHGPIFGAQKIGNQIFCQDISLIFHVSVAALTLCSFRFAYTNMFCYWLSW